MSICCGEKDKERASTESVIFPSNIRMPPTLALNATPTMHALLFKAAATSPAQRVPCLYKKWNICTSHLSPCIVA